jgi:hypothetical protein
MTAFPSYATGTVAIGAGATVIVGTGTIWSAINARAGDDIVIAGHTVIVEDVIDPAHLEIDAWPYAAVPAGAPYKIVQRSPLRFAGGQAMADVSALVAALNSDGFYVFVGPSLSAPDPSLGNDNQFAFQPSTGKLWLKIDGAWVLQGVFAALNFKGAYDPATAYKVNDVLTFGGSAYIVIAPTIGNAPPNASFYRLLVSKGDPGTNGADGAPGATGATGSGYQATSTTSLAIGTGTKVFTTQAGLAYTAGARVRASSGTTYMEGLVTAYSGTNLSVNVDAVLGTGTFATWNINLAGQPGSPLGQQQRFLFTATGGQTSFSGVDVNGATLAYTAGSVEVVVNGLWIPASDYTATNGTSVVLSSPSVAGDIVYIFALSAFNPADTLAKSQNGADVVDVKGFKKNIDTPAVGNCYLSLSGANLQLSRQDGRHLIINGALETIPAAGVTLAPTGITLTNGLAGGPMQYIYAFMSAGVMTLEFSATASAVDATYGYSIKSGDGTRTLVGIWCASAANTWSAVATEGASWFNPRQKAANTAPNNPSTASTTALSAITNAIAQPFVTFAGRLVRAVVRSSMSQSVATASMIVDLGLDGATGTGQMVSSINAQAAASGLESVERHADKTYTEGRHTLTPIGHTSTGTTTYNNLSTEVIIWG